MTSAFLRGENLIPFWLISSLGEGQSKSVFYFVEIYLASARESPKYGVNICIETKRQYRPYPQFGKQKHRDIWEQNSVKVHLES